MRYQIKWEKGGKKGNISSLLQFCRHLWWQHLQEIHCRFFISFFFASSPFHIVNSKRMARLWHTWQPWNVSVFRNRTQFAVSCHVLWRGKNQWKVRRFIFIASSYRSNSTENNQTFTSKVVFFFFFFFFYKIKKNLLKNFFFFFFFFFFSKKKPNILFIWCKANWLFILGWHGSISVLKRALKRAKRTNIPEYSITWITVA